MRRLHVAFAVVTMGLFAVASCAPSVTRSISTAYPALESHEEVLVLVPTDTYNQLPQRLGDIRIGSPSFLWNLTLYQALERVTQEARGVGANAVMITALNHLCGMSGIYSSIEFEALRFPDPGTLAIANPLDTSRATGHYALLHFYRYNGRRALVSYDIHLDQAAIARSSNHRLQTVRVSEPGEGTLWAATEARGQVPIRIAMGREYYIRAGVRRGLLVGRPALTLVSPAVGRVEYLFFRGSLGPLAD